MKVYNENFFTYRGEPTHAVLIFYYGTYLPNHIFNMVQQFKLTFERGAKLSSYLGLIEVTFLPRVNKDA